MVHTKIRRASLISLPRRLSRATADYTLIEQLLPEDDGNVRWRHSTHREALVKGSSGLCLCILAAIFYFTNPVAQIARLYLRLSEGSVTFNMWEKPPIAAYVKTYLFNVTNSEEFLNGKEDKIRVEEVGPFTYLEIRTNSDMKIDREQGVLSFTPKREVKFVPEKSIGDPKDFVLNVPNVPYLAISSLVATSAWSPYIAMTSLNILAGTLNTKVMLNLTAYEYLWGYEDTLVHGANSVLPFWIDFGKFGILDRMYDDHSVTVQVELEESKRYAIRKWNGLGGMKQWGYTPDSNSKCNRLNGSFEGILFSPNIQKEDKLTLYRKQICRTIDLEFSNEEVNDFGVKVFNYRPVSDAFGPVPDNQCMCLNRKCLKKGLSDLSPCYYRLPVAMSWPHFMDADPSVGEKVIGMKPDPKEHSTVVTIEPKNGIPLNLISSTQSNLVIEDISGSSMGSRFSNMVLPIVWMKMELQPIPDDYKTLLKLLYIYGPNILIAVEVILGLSGLFLISFQVVNIMRPYPRNQMVYETPSDNEKEMKEFFLDVPSAK